RALAFVLALAEAKNTAFGAIGSAIRLRFQLFTFAPSRFGMSALPPKADMCSAIAHVCFGPKADIAHLFDHLVGNVQQTKWHSEPKRFSGLEVDDQIELRRLLDRQVGRFFALEDAAGIDADLVICVGKIRSVAY